MTNSAATTEADDRTAWALLAGTLAFAVALGGSGSASVRALVGMGVLASACWLALGMLRQREWRFPRGMWWTLPLGAAALAIVQWTLPPTSELPGVSRPAISWHPAATLQAAAWWGVVGAAMFAAALLVRSVGRLRSLLGLLAASIAISGGIGLVQRWAGNRDCLALWSAEDRRRGEFLRDWADDASAWGAGPRAWEAWHAAKLAGADPGASRDKSLWFRAVPAAGFFGSYWSERVWGSLAVALAPALFLCAWQYWREAAGLRGGPERGQAWMCLLGAASLTAVGAAAGDPFAAPLAWTVGAAVALRNARGLPRRRMLPAALALAALAAAPLVMSAACGELQPLLGARLESFAAQWAACRDHWLFGAGLGAGDDALGLYGAWSATHPFRGSGWLAVATEIGLPALLATVVLGVLLLRQWSRHAATLPAEFRQTTGAMFAALAAFGAYALLGPGPESPIPLLIAAAGLGAVAPACVGRSRMVPQRAEGAR